MCSALGELGARLKDYDLAYLAAQAVQGFFGEVGSGEREILTKLTPYAKQANMSDEQVYAGVDKALTKYFGKRGRQVVEDNLRCIKRGYGEMKEIPAALINQ